MKRFSSIFLLVCLSTLTFAQDYKADFTKHFQASDTAAQRQVLTRWEAQDPANPELFTCWFNYYFHLSKQERLVLGSRDPGEAEGLVLQDSTGENVGFLNSEIYYEPATVALAFKKIDEGIKLYPNRLDMWFGKIYVLGKIELWDDFTETIVLCIQQSKQNSNQWLWTNNQPRKDGEDFFLSSIQSYQLTIYNTEDDSLLVNMRTIANEVLKYYPNHIESLSNIAITYILTKEYDKGLEALLKAEQINPKDEIVIANIAHAYKLKGDKNASIQYYEKLLRSKDPDAVTFAKEQIELLRKE